MTASRARIDPTLGPINSHFNPILSPFRAISASYGHYLTTSLLEYSLQHSLPISTSIFNGVLLGNGPLMPLLPHVHQSEPFQHQTGSASGSQGPSQALPFDLISL